MQGKIITVINRYIFNYNVEDIILIDFPLDQRQLVDR